MVWSKEFHCSLWDNFTIWTQYHCRTYCNLWHFQLLIKLHVSVLSSHTISVQIGDSLEEFLVEATSDVKLRQVMMSLSEAIRTIAFKVRMASASGSYLAVMTSRLHTKDNYIQKATSNSWLSWINVWGQDSIAKSYTVNLESWNRYALSLVWKHHLIF